MRQSVMPSIVFLLVGILTVSPFSLAMAEDTDSAVAEITVHARRIANDDPAGGAATLATALRFDPGVDLQSRGPAESQADVTVRGGLFEGTAVRIGAVSVFDPQTGHYSADLPIAPLSLSAPKLKTDVDHALVSFNATVATIDYALSEIQTGGHIGIGFGSDDLWSSTMRLAAVRDASDHLGVLGAALDFAMSESDGSVNNGDHDYERITLRGQRRSEHSQSDVLLAYQDKFFGWPGAYTGFANLAETDHTKTRLLLVNHRSSVDLDTGWQIGAFYRALDDDYDFDRSSIESGVPGAFDHETRSYGVGFDVRRMLHGVHWRLTGQLSGDELVSSTDLTEGPFNSRRYVSLRLAPEKRFNLRSGEVISVRIGSSFDDSNRDSRSIRPLASFSLEQVHKTGTQRWSLQYASTSQVPGYTALKSRPTGLFGGNAALGRERADTLSVSMNWRSALWGLSTTVFQRRDKGLVDWTYLSGAPFARQANAVDLDVLGVELIGYANWRGLTTTAGYTYLDKGADYGSVAVDASFYALNFARHRLTLAFAYQIRPGLELRVDNEYRDQYPNPLRGSRNSAYLASVGLKWSSSEYPGTTASLIIDNVADNEFQEFPGTPAARRQALFTIEYHW